MPPLAGDYPFYAPSPQDPRRFVNYNNFIEEYYELHGNYDYAHEAFHAAREARRHHRDAYSMARSAPRPYRGCYWHSYTAEEKRAYAIRMQEKHGIAQHTYFLAARLQNAQSDETLFPIETGHASISTEAEYTGVNIYVKTDENSDPTVVRTLNRINYILLLSIPALLAKLSILILVALIINILRKSVRDEQPLPGRIIIYTRAVGFLLILAEVCTGVGSYIYQSTTRTFLEDSPLQVAASFPLNYWNIVMAILVLFSAEVFSIGSRLSEEQKLTI